MPKKQPRNAFYFYMLDLKEEQRKKGIQYANMAEVAAAAGPLWTQAPPAIRRKFEDMAKAEKQKHNVPEQKFTSTGVSLAEIQRQALELQEAEENERQDIKNFVKLKSFNKSILKESIYLMDVNFYCKTGAEYLIGETTILRFNLEEGIKDSYHELINPGGIPVGYTLDVKLGCQEYGLEMPDDMSRRSDFIQILANSIDYLKKKNKNMKSLPPIFTMPEKVAPVTDFIQQMCSRAGEDDSLFRIYKLDTLFFTLINAIRTQEHEGFPRESLALAQLNKYKLKYEPDLACALHEESDKSMECTTSRTKRWAYIILDSCCPVVGIEAVPGRHVPYDYDMDSIQTYKEQKRERATTVQGWSGAGSASVCGSVNTSLNDSAPCHSGADTSRSEKRTHAPLRMPNTDYSQTLRPAPELTETNFPSLTAGAGRGRGLSGSFDKMKLGKRA